MYDHDRVVDIWCLNDKYYFRAFSKTTSGFWDAVGHNIHILSFLEKNNIGNKLLAVLWESQENVISSKVSEDDKMFFNALGIKTEKELNNKARLVNIRYNNAQLRIRPNAYDGKYMTPIKNQEIHCSLDPNELTEAVLEAFNRCPEPGTIIKQKK